MKRILIGLMLVLLPVLASAQTNDCDTRTGPAPAMIGDAGGYTLSVCWDAKTPDTIIAPGTETWFKLDNGVEQSMTAPTRSATPSPVKGQYLYSWTFFLAKTNVVHVYNVRVCIPDGLGGILCALGLDPVTVTSVRGKGPNSPAGGRIQ